MVQWFVIFPVLSLGSGGPVAFSLVGNLGCMVWPFKKIKGMGVDSLSKCCPIECFCSDANVLYLCCPIKCLKNIKYASKIVRKAVN